MCSLGRRAFRLLGTRSAAVTQSSIWLERVRSWSSRWTVPAQASARRQPSSRYKSPGVRIDPCGTQTVCTDQCIGIGFYGASDDRVLDEHADRGEGFLADLSATWEAEAGSVQALGVRVVCLRIGLVLEKDGGALPRMALPFRLFAGGPVMPGTQWVSWIHRADLVRLIEWAISNEKVSGPVNAVAPNPITMEEFCRTLGEVLNRPSWIPVPEVILKLVLGELGSLMTTGQRVVPIVAQSGGYRFQHPSLKEALRTIF